MLDLNVSSVQINGSSDFTLGALPARPFTIVPGGEVDATLIYHPTSKGAAPATTLRIMSDDPGLPRDLTVNGWGL